MSAGTTARSVRVPDDLWDAALAATEANGETASDVIRRALLNYVATGGKTIRYAGGTWIGGDFDGVAFYERALRPDEMAEIARGSLPPKQSGD